MMVSEFQKKVLSLVKKISKGEVVTYKEVARRAGNQRAARAVGNILRKNFDSAIPCHRVIRSDGKPGGYNRGERRKISLLRREGVELKCQMSKPKCQRSDQCPNDERRKMIEHLSQRVGVFVDVQNMYYSAKNLYQAKVNFGEVLKQAVRGRQLIRATAYVIKADIEQEKDFFEALKKIGYEVRAKDLQTFVGGAKKGDWDIGIAMDTLRMAQKLDVVVLVSGDGDFVDLVKYLKQAYGCQVEVLAFSQTSSQKLIEEADSFVDLGKNLRRLLIR